VYLCDLEGSWKDRYSIKVQRAAKQDPVRAFGEPLFFGSPIEDLEDNAASNRNMSIVLYGSPSATKAAIEEL
jgi:hypothetical protein